MAISRPRFSKRRRACEFGSSTYARFLRRFFVQQRDELPHLFDTFFRGRKAATGGVGLGLSICKGIVEAHGGRIAAYINRKGGLSISIILPDSIVPAAAAASPESV